MILSLPLQSPIIDPINDHVILIGGLENFLQTVEIQDSDNLLRRIALNQDISHLHHPNANTIIVAWLETVDLTVTPPKLRSQPLHYLSTRRKSSHFFHGSTILQEYSCKPDNANPDRTYNQENSTSATKRPVSTDTEHYHRSYTAKIPFRTRQSLAITTLNLDSPLSVPSPPTLSPSRSGPPTQSPAPLSPTFPTITNNRPQSTPPHTNDFSPEPKRPASAAADIPTNWQAPCKNRVTHANQPHSITTDHPAPAPPPSTDPNPNMTTTKVNPFSGVMNENGYEWLKDIESFFMEAGWTDDLRRCEYFRLRLRSDADRHFNSFDDITKQSWGLL
ncbi:hypothetical protein M422DRAFT_274353 [Sphaerobolus stellatus SS14]|uniref:Uncharacterized protein n=1 Tax=Sphaerobolus stellatus (strain SS14) TaxID=990650 RepID=A0A0C9UHB4_SPHS4|nr:hypothetical protein M422DRAFT_274353 [Sphaerobolus stellatus SS14]